MSKMNLTSFVHLLYSGTKELCINYYHGNTPF